VGWANQGSALFVTTTDTTHAKEKATTREGTFLVRCVHEETNRKETNVYFHFILYVMYIWQWDEMLQFKFDTSSIFKGLKVEDGMRADKIAIRCKIKRNQK
jgi:hypothetical protein